MNNTMVLNLDDYHNIHTKRHADNTTTSDVVILIMNIRLHERIFECLILHAKLIMTIIIIFSYC